MPSNPHIDTRLHIPKTGWIPPPGNAYVGKGLEDLGKDLEVLQQQEFDCPQHGTYS